VDEPPPFEAPDDPRWSGRSQWQPGHPIEPRALTFSDVIDSAFRLYRMHWRALMGFVAILVVPLRFVDEYLTRNYRHTTIFGTNTARSDRSGNLALIALVVIAISLLVVQPLLTAGLARAVGAFHLGRKPSAGEILDDALPLLPSVLLVIVLYTLVVIGGLILVVLPGLYFLIRYKFAAAAAAVEKERGRGALRRSGELTEGSFWRIVGILLVAGLITAFVSAILSLPFLIPGNHMGSSGWFLRAVGSSLGAVVAMPFSQLVVVLLYLDLRVRKEGLTLDRLQSELGSR
jgi:hypothetical protein